MRIFGIVLIAISTVLFGFLKTNSSKIRPISLQKFIACISKYKTELSWHQKSFKEIILKDNFGFDDNYYQNVLALLQDEKLADAFINKNECYAKLHLNNDDKIAIEYFLNTTGRYSLDEEIELCNKTLDFLKNQNSKATENSEKQGKLYLKLTILFAIWIFILLI